MMRSDGFDFAVTSALFLAVAFGVVVTFEGIVGRDVDLFTDVWGNVRTVGVPTATAHGTHQLGIVC